MSLGATSAPTFEGCANAVAARPDAYESYRCYYEVASSTGEWQAAGKHLAKLAAARPEIDWIVFMRAVVTASVDQEAGERLYLEAAQRFEAAGNVRGEVLARANLQSMFDRSGRVASAGREVERITALAERAQDPEVRVRARVVEAQFFISTGTNLGRAHRALLQAEAELAEMPAYWLRQHVLHGLGSVLLLTGQYDEAVAYFRRLEDEAQAQHDLVTIARARLDVVNALLEKRSEAPHAVDPAQLASDAEEALVAAQSAQDLDVELGALRQLGEVLMEKDPLRAKPYASACVEKARRSERSQLLSQCLWITARVLADTDPIGAQRAIDAAINLLQHEQGTDHGQLAYAWRHAMRIAWRTQPHDAAVTTGKQALDAIERLRDLQPGSQSRAAAFSTWTQDYYWLSGRILRLAMDPKRSAQPDSAARARSLVDEAFQISERMRARSLLDQLNAPATPVADVDDAALRRREALLKSIVDVNRQLLASKGDKTALLNTLAALEREEVDAREAQDRTPAQLKPISVSDVQRRLAPNEALLSFQIGAGGDSADGMRGGSWLFVVTREHTQVHELPDRHSLTQSFALFKGLIRQPSHRAHAGAALYGHLLSHAVEAMPPGIDRLIVVPDSPLDTFPLAALNRSLAVDPLARHYEIALVPSATIWHDWRARSAATASRSALVLADPKLEFASDANSQTRSWLQDSGLPLGPLPYARAEGREIVQQLRGRGTLLVGVDASEAALKASDLSRYGVIHFAAHTVVDSVNTDRSSILLASGTDQQDGLLQSREIADLRLDGQLVVLSSCQSATGTHVRGEGVLGLARSFFAAGARVVVGSLWPIRDDHAAAFFDPFYVALADGRSVGGAFHYAQRRLIDAGLPMEAWAGFVLIGDADAVPVSRVDRGWASTWPWIVAGVVLILIAGGVLARFRRRHSSLTT